MPIDLNSIDPRWIDVDFEREARDNGRFLGCAGSGNLNRLRSYGDVVPEMSTSEIEAAIEKMDAADDGAEHLITRIYDQNGEGSCVANACCQALEVMLALQFGKSLVTHLSAMSVYQFIGSSPNSGAMVSDGLDRLQEAGAVPLDNAENRARFGNIVMPNCGWRTPRPAGWEAVAKNFRIDEAYVVRNVNQLMTALCRRRPVVVGRAGHSICYIRPKAGGKVVYVNSWGGWGFAAGDFQHGFGLDTGGMVRSSASWAFVVNSAIVPNYALAA